MTDGWIHQCDSHPPIFENRERWFTLDQDCIFCGMQPPEKGTEDGTEDGTSEVQLQRTPG